MFHNLFASDAHLGVFAIYGYIVAMSDSRRALLYLIITEARRVIRHAEDALLSDAPGDREEPRRLCAWLYRLACEVAMVRGWSRPRIDARIEAEAIQASKDQDWTWHVTEVAKQAARWMWK